MRINLLLKITLVALVLLGLSLRSAVSAGGSYEEVFPPKTLEKLKKNYSTQKQKKKNSDVDKGSKKSVKSAANDKDGSVTSKKSNQDSLNSDKTGVDRASSTDSVLEDEPLIADLTSIIDKDGIGEVNVVWKLSNDGSSYRTIPGATNQSFTPRQEHVGKTLRVVLTYLDGQGNLETLTSAATTPVINVNDKPTGVVRLTVKVQKIVLLY